MATDRTRISQALPDRHRDAEVDAETLAPETIAEVAEASGVAQEEVADFVNANLATGYAESARQAPPEPETPPQKPAGGLFGRMRGR